MGRERTETDHGYAGADDDDPMPTRWSFEDFEEAYDILFGRGKDMNGKSDGVNDLHGEINGVADETGRIISNGTDGFEENQKQTAMENGATPLTPSKPHISKPPKAPLLYYSNDMQELAENITRDILKADLDVRWDDVKGLDTAKRLLKEAVVMPIKYPQYFIGLLTPWKGIMLFGPPGTGKTMLAKAVATECNTTFFNISASSIVSKWRGDSEKLIRVLFELARHHAPSTIFLDELDSIISQRGEGPEHEASRRLKTELLVQMDGLNKSQDLVFVLAATNLPWELDSAMLRRLEKRILVPLPDPEARGAMFEALLPASSGQVFPYDFMVDATEGYSGSDIRLVCKEAAMWPVRRLLKELEEKGDTWQTETELPQPGPVTEEDVTRALKVTKSSAHAHTAQYQKFEDEYGSHTL